MRLAKSFLIVGFLITTFFLKDVWASQNIKFNLSSPYHSTLTFLKYLQDDTFMPQIAAKAFEQTHISEEEAIEYAIKLKQALDGKGYFIKIDELPRNSRYFDTITGLSRYVLVEDYPGIYLELKGKRWLFPEATFDEIDIFHSQVFPYGTAKLLDVLPKIGSKKYFGLYVWQHISILIIIILAFILHKGLYYIIEKAIYKSVCKLGYGSIAESYFIPIAKPISILLISILIILLLPVLQLPPKASYYINIVIKALMPVFGTLVFYKMVDVLCLYLEKLAGKTETTLDDQLVPLIRKVLKVFVVVIGGLFILQNLNVNITALLAGISIGGLAFALAAQDTLKNFFGSLMIFLDKPFQIGHWITTSDLDGTVEEVGFRSTRVRTFRNSLTYVPNGKLADTTIDNHGLREFRRFSTTISITYDTPPELIELFIKGLNEIVSTHPETRKDFYIIRLNDLGVSSLNILFYIFFNVPNWQDELRCREEILIKVLKLANDLDVRFAFPTQTLHMETFPEKTSLTPVYDKSFEEQRKRYDVFFKK